MAFFLTQKYEVPKPSKLFWACHLIGWSIQALITSLMAIIIGANFSLGIFSFFLILISNTLVCLKFRCLIHGKKLLTLPFKKVWKKLALYSLTLAMISTVIIYLSIAVFQSVWPQDNLSIFGNHRFFFPPLFNWLSLSVLIFIWGLLYLSVKYSNLFKDAQRTSDALQLELKNSQLNTLMAQLNPHFLFNALNNIRSLILENPKKSREMITRLSEILRYSLLSDKHEYEILENEIDVVRAYLKLASIQYEDRLQYIENIDSSLLKCHIPPMIIQMLIENAVKYGIDQTSTGGEIRLSILPKGNIIDIEVINPGTLQDKKNDSTGLGVNNIKKRLYLLYENEAEFSIEQIEDRVVSRVTIPMEPPSIKTEL